MKKAIENVNNQMLRTDTTEKEFISGACKGEKCTVCGKGAFGKVAEQIMFDDHRPMIHELTAYLCKEHFTMVLKPYEYKSHSEPSGKEADHLNGIKEKNIELLADKMISNYCSRGTYKTWDNKYIPTYDEDTVREMLCNFITAVNQTK